MKNYIENCYSDIIISTRIEITEILSKYYKGKGILLKRVVEGRKNSIRDDISIEYDIDIDNY